MLPYRNRIDYVSIRNRLNYKWKGRETMTVYGITGASGQLGRLTTEALEQRVSPDQLVLITRSPGTLAEYAARGIDVRAGDFNDADSLRAAFAGIDRLLIISTDRVGARLEGHLRAIAAASDAGVSHLLYTSIPEPTPENPSGVVPDHAATEKAIRDSGLGWTFLRNALYAEGQLGSIEQAAASGQLVTNAGDGTAAYVTRADCARAAAAALVQGEGNASYDITGPDALSTADLAALAAGIRGSAVEVIDVSDEAVVQGLVEHGLPQPIAALLASFGTATRLGFLSTVSTAVADLTGTPPAPLSSLLDGAQPR